MKPLFFLILLFVTETCLAQKNILPINKLSVSIVAPDNNVDVLDEELKRKGLTEAKLKQLVLNNLPFVRLQKVSLEGNAPLKLNLSLQVLESSTRKADYGVSIRLELVRTLPSPMIFGKTLFPQMLWRNTAIVVSPSRSLSKEITKKIVYLARSFDAVGRDQNNKAGYHPLEKSTAHMAKPNLTLKGKF